MDDENCRYETHQDAEMNDMGQLGFCEENHGNALVQRGPKEELHERAANAGWDAEIQIWS